MITKCRFCDYQKSTPLNLESLKRYVALSPEAHTEDVELYMRILLEEYGLSDWRSVKIHMGRMHKEDAYYGIWPDHILELAEQEIVK